MLVRDTSCALLAGDACFETWHALVHLRCGLKRGLPMLRKGLMWREKEERGRPEVSNTWIFRWLSMRLGHKCLPRKRWATRLTRRRPSCFTYAFCCWLWFLIYATVTQSSFLFDRYTWEQLFTAAICLRESFSTCSSCYYLSLVNIRVVSPAVHMLSVWYVSSIFCSSVITCFALFVFHKYVLTMAIA